MKTTIFSTLVATALVATTAVTAAKIETPVARATQAAERRQLASLNAEFSQLAANSALAPIVGQIQMNSDFSSAVGAALTSDYAPIASFFGSLEANPTIQSELVSAVGTSSAMQIFGALSSELAVAAAGAASTVSSSVSSASSSFSSNVASASSNNAASTSSAMPSATSAGTNPAATNAPAAAAAGLAGLAIAAFIGI